MGNLLNKELTLSAAPLTYVMLAFSAMTLIPGYPILVGVFFVCLGLFYSFQSGRECNDVLFTALLPVEKADVVRAKFAFVLVVEGAAIGLMLLFALLRMTLLAHLAVYTQNVMMSANFVYLAFALLIFGLFNALFVCGFFSTAYAIGKPFIRFCVAAFLAVGLGETLHHLPGLGWLNALSGSELLAQLPIFLLGLGLFAALTVLSLGRARKTFVALDL